LGHQAVSSDAKGRKELTSFLIIDDHPAVSRSLGQCDAPGPSGCADFRGDVDQGRAWHSCRSEQGIDLALLDLSVPDATGFSDFLRRRERIRGFLSLSSRATSNNK
jgi:DNA-binding NarL/FixJ family response regulator